MPVKEFVVVEFDGEKSVAVAHRSWLSKVVPTGELICFFPKHDAAKRAKSMEIPDKKNWKPYEVRILSSADTYVKANEHLKRAEDTSNIESGTEEEIGGRQAKRPARYDSANDHDESDDSEEERPQKKKKMQAVSLPAAPAYVTPSSSTYRTICSTNDKRILSPMGIGTYSTVRNRTLTRNKTTSPRSPVSSVCTETERGQSSSPQNRTESGSDTPSSGFQFRVLMKLDKIIQNQSEEITLRKKLVITTGAANVDGNEDVLPAPVDGEEQLLALCEKVTKEQLFRKQLLTYLTSLGAVNLGTSVRTMLRKVGTNSLWSLYSLKGRKGKKKFADMSICNLVIRACLKNHPRAKIGDVELEIVETLKHAPNKVGGKNKKAAAGNASATEPSQMPSMDLTSDEDEI